MKQEESPFLLKWLVISLGVLLVLAPVALLASIALRPPAVKCTAEAIDLKGRGRIVTAALEGSRARFLLHQEGEGYSLAEADPCSGRVTRSIAIRSD